VLRMYRGPPAIQAGPRNERTVRLTWIFYAGLSIYGRIEGTPAAGGGAAGAGASPWCNDCGDGEITMGDLVDIAIPANAQAAAESLGLKVSRSVTSGARVRQIPREDAEIALACLSDWGFTARIVEEAPPLDDDVRPAA
jgi:hypothetical protein